MIGRISNIIYSVPELKILDKAGNVIENKDILSSTTMENKENDKKVIFGSTKGKYFYYKGCGGESLSTKNLVYYKTEAEAIKAGKILYKNCQ